MYVSSNRHCRPNMRPKSAPHRPRKITTAERRSMIRHWSERNIIKDRRARRSLTIKIILSIMVLMTVVSYIIYIYFTVVMYRSEGSYTLLPLMNFDQEDERNAEVPVVARYDIPKRDVKNILVWNEIYDNVSLGCHGDIFKDCPVSTCVTTCNRSVADLPVEQYDAIIFHTPNFHTLFEGLPKTRSVHQKYIFMSLESPYHTYWQSKLNNHFFNWTMTYRTDSDIYWPYAFINPTRTNYTVPSQKAFLMKFRSAAWFVSNCLAMRRLRYARKLSKYMKSVDIYGDCGEFYCAKNESKQCYEMIEKRYLFYLSFENTHCPDYVTEKLFNPMRYDIVPIVFGPDNLTGLVPPKSVINARDFDSPEHLAKFLKNLSSNYYEYVKYFEWKKNYEIVPVTNQPLCQLCEKLHDPVATEYSSYEEIDDWFLGSKCFI